MAEKLKEVIIYTDGGSRGNPGPAAAGFVVTGEGNQTLQAKGVFLGVATNNVAEYTGLVEGLEAAIQLGAGQVRVYSDSELLVRQINGQYKVKSANIKPLYNRSCELLGKFDKWQVNHVTRDKNVQADELVNLALDRGCDVEDKAAKGPSNKKPVRVGVWMSG